MDKYYAIPLQAKKNAALKFFEGGKYHKEEIIFDDSAYTAEYLVPAHNNLEETKYLFDFKNVS